MSNLCSHSDHRACVRVCVRVVVVVVVVVYMCVRACVRACVRVCVYFQVQLLPPGAAADSRGGDYINSWGQQRMLTYQACVSCDNEQVV